MKRSTLVLAGLVAALFLAVLVWSPWSPDLGVGRSTNPTNVPSAGDTSSNGPETVGGDLASTPSASTGRTSVEGSMRIVAQSSGAPLPATASWSIDDALWNAESPWPFRAWDLLLESSTVERAGVDGELRMRSPADVAQRASRLWITHPGYLAMCLELPAGPPALPEQIALLDAPPIRARVVDAGGRAVRGATVRVVLDLRPVDRRFGSLGERKAGNYLVRSASSDANGDLTLPALGASQLCWAEHEALVSELRRVAPGDTVRLQLEPAVEIRGNVIATEPGIHFQDAHASVYRALGSLGDRIARVPVESDGRFGPIRIPADAEAIHTMQVQGPAFVVGSEEFRTPVSGGPLNFEIRVVRGVDVPMRVVEVVGDSDIRPVADAYVSVLWQVGTRWEKARALTDADGMASVGRLPLFRFSIDVRADGFVPFEAHYEAASDVTPFLELPVERGATVHGRVLEGDVPVTDFTVFALDSGTNNRRTQAFRGRKDGAFSVSLKSDRAWTLFAVTEDRVQQNSVVVDPRAKTPIGEVVLRIAAPREARGRVIDSRTNEPVAGAGIQALTSHGATPLGPFGAVVLTREDGSFDGVPLAPGRGYITVTHDSYAQTMEACEVRNEGVSDFGVIGLGQGSSLLVQLNLPPEVEPSSVQCLLGGPGNVEPRRLDPSGAVRFDRLTAGDWTITLIIPDYRFVQRTLRVRQETAHEITVDLSPSRVVEVQVVTEPGVELPSVPVIAARTVEQTGGARSSISYAPIPIDRLARVDSMGFDQLQLLLLDGEWREVAGSPTIDLRKADRPVRFVIGGARREALVVDQEGRPLGNVRCALHEFESGWSSSVTTDALGRFSVPEPPFERVSLLVMNGDAGYGILNEVPAQPFPVEIRCEFDASLDVAVRDRGMPVPGLTVFLEDGDRGEVAVELLPTDSTGRVRFGPLIACAYTLTISNPSVWPVAKRVEAERGGTSVALEVRRRGSASIDVRRGGAPVVGQLLRIRSEEFETDVHDWVDQGRVAAPSGLASDAHGRVRVDGLPNGSYRWECAVEDGQVVTGRFEVPPMARVDLRVDLP